MMIAARNAFLMSGAKLPYDAEVEYLESTGTQWIDTGLLLATTDAMGILLDFVHLGSSTRNLFGSNDAQGLNAYLQSQTDLGLYLCGGYVAQHVPISVNERHSLSWSVAANGSGVLVFDGTTRNTSRRTLQQSTSHFFLFTQIPEAQRASSLKMFSCSISIGGALVRDFIPVRVGSGSSAVGYLYDRANPTGGPLGNGLYGNAGTGAFVIGPDKP